MPQIPTFLANENIAPVRDTARADPNALAAPGQAAAAAANQEGERARQMQQAGRSLEDVGSALGKVQEFENSAYVADNWSGLTIGAHERLQNGIDDATRSGNYRDFSKTQLDQFDQDAQSRLDNAPSGAARIRLEKHFATERDRVLSRSTNFEHAAASQDHAASRLSAADRLPTLAYRDPSMTDSLMQQFTLLQDQDTQLGLLNPLQREKETRAFSDMLWAESLRGRVRSDPSVLNDFNAGRFDQNLTPAARERLKPILENEAVKGLRNGLPTAGFTTGGGAGGHLNYGATGALGDPSKPGWAAANLIGVSAPSGASFQVNKAAAADFTGFLKDLEATGYQIDPGQSGGHSYRNMRGGSHLSEHAYGTAIDINSEQNPYSAEGQKVTNLPANIAEIAARHNLEWGGDWSKPNDPMHFQWHGPDASPAGGPSDAEKVLGAVAAAAGGHQQQQAAAGGLAGLYAHIDKMGLDPDVAQKLKAGARLDYDALEADQARQQRQAEHAQKLQSDTAENAIIADSRSDAPKIAARDVANMDALSPAAKLRMIQFLAKDGVVDPGLSHTTAIGLMKGIAAGEVTDQAPIIQAFGAGQLNWQDFDHLGKQLNDIKTPAGETLAKRKGEFLKAVEPQIDKTPLLPAGIDQKGKERFYEFQYMLDQKIDEYRAAHKNPGDLFDPSKPDYLGKPEALKQYQRPMAEILKDVSEQIGVGTAAGAVDLTTQAGIIAAYKAGKIGREQAARALIAAGFAASPAPPATPAAPAAAPPVR